MPLNEVKTILIDTLSLGPSGEALTADSPLLGSLPELDSMAVVALLAAIEDHFGVRIDDDEISADAFATLGSLDQFVTAKLTA